MNLRRALVLSGGGAKGVFEAGVIHALIQTALPLHILTGSSIGAINSAFFAEYLYRQRGPQADREDDRQLAARLQAYLDLWESLADERFIDLDGPHFLRLARSLTRPNISLGDLTRLFWQATTPDPPPARLPGSLLTPFQTLLNGLAAVRVVTRLTFQVAARFRRAIGLLAKLWETRAAFLARKGSPAQVEAERRFNREVRPVFQNALLERLRSLDIQYGIFQRDALRTVLIAGRPKDHPAFPLVPATRRFSAYREAGIDLRLTRTNLRSGRLEHSACFTPGQALFSRDAGRKFVLKESRDLRVFGDPRVVEAALASGAFPFAIPPRSFDEIYPAPEPGEPARHQELLLDFVNYLAARDRVGPAGPVAPPRCRWQEAGEELQADLTEADWNEIAKAFPRPGDLYTDGGAIDNTPLASAIAAARDAQAGELEAIVVMLDPAPEYRAISGEALRNLDPVKIGLRALELQAVARLERDADHAEMLTRRFAGVMKEAGLAPQPQESNEGWTGPRGFTPVKVIRLWPLPPPAARPLPPLLAFDERLGYNRADSRAAIVQGCAALLWAVWQHWEKADPAALDEADRAARQRVESFVRPAGAGQPRAASTWACANRQCRYYQESTPELRCPRAE